MTFRSIDLKILHILRKISEPVARGGIFIIFFWFGFLKVIGLSPASPLVGALLGMTMPWMPAPEFVVGFGVLECVIGLLFLWKGMERVAVVALFLHMITTAMPLFLLPHIVWTGFLVPTLEGQYIIKNLAIIAAAIGIAAHIHPIRISK